MTATLGVIGNVSIDTIHRPDGTSHHQLGGAALYLALAAADSGVAASPISVIGDGLASLHTDHRLDGLDLAHVVTVPGPDCRFHLTYDHDGQVTSVRSNYGVAEYLTGHALTAVAGSEFDHWHVACRRPLDTAQIVGRLAAAELSFSVDFHLASAIEQIRAVSALLPRASVVFVNTTEHQALARHVDLDAVAAVVVSDGPGQVRLRRHGKPITSAAPPTITVEEVTGAGDVLAGTFLALTTRGVADRDALTAAAAAASRHVASPGLRYQPRDREGRAM